MSKPADTSRVTIANAQIRLDRLPGPNPLDDLAMILRPDIDPDTGRNRSGFESDQDARRELRARIRSLERASKDPSSALSTAARDHAQALNLALKEDSAGMLPSFADPRFNRNLRRKFDRPPPSGPV